MLFTRAGTLECWRERILRYADDYKWSYFDVLTEIHESLGLNVKHDSAVAMASLVYATTSLIFQFSQL